MKRASAFLLLAALCALSLGCLSQMLAGVMGSDTEIGHAARVIGKTADGFRKIPLTEETEYGRSIGAQAFAAYGLFRCPEAEQYLNLVVSTVGAYSDRPSITYYAAILNEDAMNALSAPGGYVFITWRMLLSLEDESELAGVMGHEIAHVCEKHVLKTMQNVKRKEALLEAVSGGDQNAFNALMDGIMGGVFGAPASRHQEVNCDRLGSVYIVKAGYNGEGLARALRRIAEHGGDPKGRHYGKLGDRADLALRYQKELGYSDRQGVKLQERYLKRCIEPLKQALAKQGIRY
ncbi:MAG: M48 family metalloprotease [Planctomycetes bacterium]|nr:M48 family metalloprotease [Planctomycetota bacterium]